MTRIYLISAAAVLGVLAFLYWQRVPAPANLVYLDVGVSEATYPVTFAIQVENRGTQAPELSSVEGSCSWSYVIASPGDESLIPDGFNFDVRVIDFGITKFRPDSPDLITLALTWNASEIPLDLLAVVEMSFTVQYDDSKSITTAPKIFLVGNSEKVQGAIARGGIDVSKSYGDLPDLIESRDSIKSKRTLRWIKKLREASQLPSAEKANAKPSDSIDS